MPTPCSPVGQRSDCESDFSEQVSESDDDLEQHLPLLVPEELADLAIDALRFGHHDAAVRYLLLAQSRWSETLGRRLAMEGVVQVGRQYGRQTPLLRQTSIGLQVLLR